MSVLEDDFELRPEMELVAIYFAVTVIRIIQMEGSHLELFNCPFEYSIAIEIRAGLLQKKRHHNKNKALHRESKNTMK